MSIATNEPVMSKSCYALSVETECGWKGRLRDVTPRKDRLGEESTRTSYASEMSSAASEGEGGGGSADDDFVAKRWLGGEPHLLPLEVEQRGVLEILRALTAAEKEQLEAYDTTMPIRHFRAEKVRAQTSAFGAFEQEGTKRHERAQGAFKK